MIKIKMTKDQQKNLEEWYWNYIENHYLENWKRRIETFTELKKIFKDKEEIKKIILANIDELEKLKSNFQIHDKKEAGYLLGQYSRLRRDIGQEILKKLNISTCPYCNRSYIHSYGKESKPRFQFDHFHSKSKYPFLALSLYNLIPCCHSCNMIKSDEDKKELINPFNESFGENGKFVLENSSKNLKDFLNCSDQLKITIQTKGSNKKKIDNSIEIFGLIDIYNTHSSEVMRLSKIKKIYSDSQLTEYIESFGEKLRMTENEIRELIYGFSFEEENEDKRILSKFQNDILKDLEEQIDY